MNPESQPAQGAGASGKASSPPARPKKRRKWLSALVLIGLVVVVLIVLAPYLLSSGPGRQLVVSLVNSRIAGSLTVRDMSLSWTGPCTVSGLQVFDVQGREVLNTEVTWSHGLLQAVRSLDDFGRVEARAPNVVLYEQNGTVSLAEAIQPVKVSRSKPEPGKPTIVPRGTVRLTAGRVRFKPAHGPQYQITDVNTELDLDSLDDIKGQLELTFAHGGQLKGRFHARDLMGRQQSGIRSVQVAASVATTSPIDLQPLAALVGKPTVQGKLDLKADVQMQQGNPTGTVRAFVTNLTVAAPEETAQAPPKPIDLGLLATFRNQPQPPSQQTIDKLKRLPVWLHLDTVYAEGAILDKAVFDQVKTAVLAGKSISLPRIDVNVQGQGDLARVCSALPGLLKVRPDTQVTGGKLYLRDIHAFGGRQPGIKGQIRLADLTAVNEGRQLRFDPVALNVDAVLADPDGLTINKAQLDCNFAKAQLTGSFGNLIGQFQADLDKLHQQLAQVFDLKNMTLQGQTEGTVRLARLADDRLEAVIDLTATKLRYAAAESKLAVAKAALKLPATMDLDNGRLQTIKIDQGRFILNDKAKLAFNVDWNLPQHAGWADAALESAGRSGRSGGRLWRQNRQEGGRYRQRANPAFSRRQRIAFRHQRQGNDCRLAGGRQTP